MAEAEVPSLEQRAKVLEKAMYNQYVFVPKGDGRSGEESSRGSSGCCLVQGCSRHSWWIKG